MIRAAKLWLAVVGAGAGLAVLAPASYASGALLHLKAPRTVSASVHFRITASGTGTQRTNYLAVFYTQHNGCPATYAGAASASHTVLLQSEFVGRSFSVKLHKIFGGKAASGRFCGYLYPKETGTSWQFQQPDARTSRKITFT